MPHVHSFPPVENPSARVLILGSMPGVVSLRENQYYAHPRNAFWRIMGMLIGAGIDLPYETRLKKYTAAGLALWDVLKCCTREGSLDSSIDESSIEANDFPSFFHRHKRLERVYFNGTKAEQAFKKYVLPCLFDEFAGIQYKRLPSTSPANASKSFEEKLEAWRMVLQ